MNASVEEHGLEEHLHPQQILRGNHLVLKCYLSSHFASLHTTYRALYKIVIPLMNSAISLSEESQL